MMSDIGACRYDVRFPQKRTLNPPKIFEAGRRKFGVSNCVLDAAVAQISLQRPRVVPLVGERVSIVDLLDLIPL